jgi:hypothetical protein
MSSLIAFLRYSLKELGVVVSYVKMKAFLSSFARMWENSVFNSASSEAV